MLVPSMSFVLLIITFPLMCSMTTFGSWAKFLLLSIDSVRHDSKCGHAPRSRSRQLASVTPPAVVLLLVVRPFPFPFCFAVHFVLIFGGIQHSGNIHRKDVEGAGDSGQGVSTTYPSCYSSAPVLVAPDDSCRKRRHNFFSLYVYSGRTL